MVKVLLLGLLAFTMCGFVSAVSVSKKSRSNHPESPSLASPSSQPLQIEDPSVRSERSTNLSHITGTARKIQMYIKNRHLQLLPDGTVNGTLDDHSIYTILQRTTVGIGQLKIQGVATCQYLCMDGCGLLYGSKEFNEECVFNEMIEQHHYNTYSSTKYSNNKRTLYLALNRRGQPRKVMLKANQQLGRLSSYTRVLTRTVAPERSEELHPVRHMHFCTAIAAAPVTRSPLLTDLPTDTPRCRKRKKKKKKKRKCVDVNVDSELCNKNQTFAINKRTQTLINSNRNNSNNNTSFTKKCETEESDECQRVEVVDKKRHKSKLSDNGKLSGVRKRKKHQKGMRSKKARVITTTENILVDDTPSDEDYTVDTTTAWDWEDSTTMHEDSSTARPD